MMHYCFLSLLNLFAVRTVKVYVIFVGIILMKANVVVTGKVMIIDGRHYLEFQAIPLMKNNKK